MTLTVEQRRERDRAYYHKTRARRLELQKARYAVKKDKVLASTRKSVLKVKYGLTPEDVDRMLAEQDNKCLICCEPLKQSAIDHCHRTGKVRGILCGTCNRSLGLFRDDPKILQNAINYLVERGG